MSEPLVYVIVINWNGREHLHECFTTLLASTYRHVRFLLVDNASTDASVEYVRSEFGHDERVEVLETGENLGWSRGNNAGIQHALDKHAQYVLLLNNDTATHPEAIRLLVDAADRDPSIGALAPKLLLYDQPYLLNGVGLELSRIGSAWDRGLGRVDRPPWDGVDEVIGVCGAAMFLRTEALHRVGLLPTDFDIYLDDLDLCLRIWNAGYRILTCPSAVFRHKFGATMGFGPQARRRYFLNTRNRFQLMLRNYPIAKSHQFVPRTIFAELRALGSAVKHGEWWRIGAHMRAWIGALSYIPTAIRERRNRRRTGISTCRFWDRVRRNVSFYPGITLPERGWYPLCTVNGIELQPISVEARYDHAGGKLEITLANKYPDLGEREIIIQSDGKEIERVRALHSKTIQLDLPIGELVLTCPELLDADVVGETYDIGAWVRVDHIQE